MVNLKFRNQHQKPIILLQNYHPIPGVHDSSDDSASGSTRRVYRGRCRGQTGQEDRYNLGTMAYSQLDACRYRREHGAF